MRTLLIDNYDSYTFNLFHLLGQVNGEEPIVVANDERPWAQLRRWAFDNVVISPGPGRPEHPRDVGVSMDALRQARVPVLGVCLGHQALALVSGGAVEHAGQVMHGRLSEIEHTGDGLFAGVPQRFAAVRYHSLVVDRLPPELRVTAWTSDGVVMALEHRERPLLGVQFHPESVLTDHGAALLTNFRDLTERGRGRRARSAAAAPPTGLPAAARPIAEPAVRVRHRCLDGAVDSEAAFATLFGDVESAVWLDSARTAPGVARFSYLGGPLGRLGRVVRYDVTAGRLTIERGGVRTEREESVFAYCARELERLRADAPELPFDFVGGFAGYLGYELKAECGARAAHVSPHPDAALVLCDRMVVVDHLADRTYLVALEAGDPEAVRDWMAQTAARLGALAPPPHPSPPGSAAFTLREDRDAYLANIEACRRQIVEGESYEVCLTTELSSSATVAPLAAYRSLRARNPAPFAALLRLGELSVLSSSPERFLRVDRDGHVESKPIKGTSARVADPAEDARRSEALRTSPDFRAENLMIADLVRNDLGRVCELGSIHVPALMVVESHATVHQLVSVVRGTLRPGVGALDAVLASFPGGSMTGAPKLRTMEIIDELEDRPRGIYSGALGFLSVNGTADLNIVIRTLVVTPDGMSIGSGGAILAGADPEAEFVEMLLKARPVLDAVGGELPAPRGAPAALR